MSRGTVVLLCNLTDAAGADWAIAGYDVVMVDPQHGTDSCVGNITRIASTIVEAMPRLAQIGDAVLTAGFPPCTDVAVSGARWWGAKRAADPYFQAKAAIVAEQCRTVGVMLRSKWFFENPVSAFSRIFGAPSHTFSPSDFTGYEPEDNYTKKTCLWSGGGFVMPHPFRDETLGEPDDRIHKAPPGAGRANFRSATPRGFCRGMFLANAPHLAAATNDNHEEAARAS